MRGDSGDPLWATTAPTVPTAPTAQTGLRIRRLTDR